MKKITIKLTRDEARTVQVNFCPFLESLCETKIRLAVTEDERLLNMLVRSIFLEIFRSLSRKLLTDAKVFKLQLSEAEAITLYKLLAKLPIEVSQVWCIKLRQMILDTLHYQLQQPDHESFSQKADLFPYLD